MKFLNGIKELSCEHKAFCIFLFVHFVVWTSVGLIRSVLPVDALEGIYWGSLHDFGTPKHPPISGWITYFIYSLFKSDFSIYFLSQAFIVGALYYIYKLGKFFIDDTKAVLATIMLEGCWVYSYITGYYGFNPDVILLFLLPLLTYIFCQCITTNKSIDWIKLGIITGVCFLTKYQTALVLIPMAVWTMIFRRDVFKNKMFYISVIIAFLIFLPHLLWLIKYDFFPLLYFKRELGGVSIFKHIIAPMSLLISQFSAIAVSILIFAGLKYRQKAGFMPVKNPEKDKAWLLLILYFFPTLFTVIMTASSGTGRFRWGFEFLYLSTIMLFYFFPVKEITKNDFKFVLKCAYTALLITFLALGGLLSIEKNYRSRYPVQKIYSDINKIWYAKYKTPLKYLGGYIEWTLPPSIYGKDHPQVILDTHGYKNPWIDEDDLKKSGAFILGREEQYIDMDTKNACPYLDKNYKVTPQPYSFEVKNAFGKKRQYDIFYYIVPPQN